MNVVSEQKTSCPYCGEPIHLLVDCSEAEQSYIEDCEVCCRPMVIHAFIDDEEVVSITVHQEND